MNHIPSDIQILHVLYYKHVLDPKHNRPVQAQLQTNINKIKTYCFVITTGMMKHSLTVSNANDKGWTNSSRLRILLLIYKFTKWKFYQMKWLWFLGFYYSRQQKYTRPISSQSPAVLLPKKKKLRYLTVMQISESH